MSMGLSYDDHVRHVLDLLPKGAQAVAQTFFHGVCQCRVWKFVDIIGFVVSELDERLVVDAQGTRRLCRNSRKSRTP